MRDIVLGKAQKTHVRHTFFFLWFGHCAFVGAGMGGGGKVGWGGGGGGLSSSDIKAKTRILKNRKK